MEKKIRRYRNILVTSGWGIIILGLFPILQMLMFFFLMPEVSNAMLELNGADASLRGWVIAISLVLLGIELLFRVLAGRSAIRLGTGRKRTSAAIVFGIMILIETIVLIFFEIIMKAINLADVNTWILIIINFFSLFVNIQMLVAAIFVRHYEKKQLQADIKSV